MPDIAAETAVVLNFSAVGNANGFTEDVASGNNLAFGTNLLLGPLANNGGPTFTHLPGSGSPLIDAGNNPDPVPSPNVDQRGLNREIGVIDIGAVEVQGRNRSDRHRFHGQRRQCPALANHQDRDQFLWPGGCRDTGRSRSDHAHPHGRDGQRYSGDDR